MYKRIITSIYNKIKNSENSLLSYSVFVRADGNFKWSLCVYLSPQLDVGGGGGRKQAIVIDSVEEYKCTRRQMCTFEGAHVNPPTKIDSAKWGSPDIRFDTEHNRLSHGWP